MSTSKQLFAVDMSSTHCQETIQQLLHDQVTDLKVDLKAKTVQFTSHLPPSHSLSLLRSTGMNTILRGISSPLSQSNSPYTLSMAAVCIFESFKGAVKGWIENVNKGLARLIQLDENQMLLDLSVHDLIPSTRYTVDVYECGDLSCGISKIGSVFYNLGQFTSTQQGTGELISEISGISVWQIIGRSIVLQPLLEMNMEDSFVAGIIARSAGVFENPKEVCTCSGKTLWEESKL